MNIPQDIPLLKGQHVECRGLSGNFPGVDYYVVIDKDGHTTRSLWCQDKQGTVHMCDLNDYDYMYRVYHKQGGDLFS